MKFFREVVASIFVFIATIAMVAAIISLVGLARMGTGPFGLISELEHAERAKYAEYVNSRTEEPRYTEEEWEKIYQDPMYQGNAPIGGGRNRED